MSKGLRRALVLPAVRSVGLPSYFSHTVKNQPCGNSVGLLIKSLKHLLNVFRVQTTPRILGDSILIFHTLLAAVWTSAHSSLRCKAFGSGAIFRSLGGDTVTLFYCVGIL